MGGVPGVAPANVVVLGGGVSGTNAARMAVGLEASVTIIDKSLPRLKELDLQFGPRATTLFATAAAIEHQVLAADLVIGAVLVPGAAAPKLVSRDMVRQMREMVQDGALGKIRMVQVEYAQDWLATDQTKI